MPSIENRIIHRIRQKRRGWCFTPTDFLDLGSRQAVDTALSRLTKYGHIRRLARGLYNYPKYHQKIGILFPSLDDIVEALTRKDKVKLQPSGAYAANLLGLSNQVPMKVVFLTDGPSRKVQVGNQTIILKHTTPRNMSTAGKTSGLVIQALRYLGQDGVDSNLIKILGKRLDSRDKVQLLNDIRYAPAWIASVIRKIASKEEQ